MRAHALVVLAAAVAGCGFSSPNMRTMPQHVAVQPPPGGAVVYFVRPSWQAKPMGFTILETSGRFVCDVGGETYCAIGVPAGHHVFLAWAENTAALQADLVAGKTYFVEVSPRIGAITARVQLTKIAPGSSSWAKRDTWIAHATQLVPDEAVGQAYLDGRRGDVAEHIARANAILHEYNASELAERTILPQDGI